MDTSPTSQTGIASYEQKPVSSSSSVPPSQTSSTWNSNSDYKVKLCMNSQCNGIHHGAYDGISIPGDSCQPRHQTSMFSSFPQQSSIISHDKKEHQQPNYMMGYQVPLRTPHHPQHTATHCHPHHAHQQVASNVDRILQSGSVTVAAQMRSMAMNHYPSTGGYNHSTSSSYYTSAPATSAGSVSYIDYTHHGPAMSASSAAVQFAAHQHQRVASVANTFRATPHHTKVISPSQAVAYQQAYHQYQQYIQHQGILHSNHQNHHPVVQQRMIGIPMIHNHNGGSTSVHQQSRLVPFINHGSHALPQSQSHAYHNGNIVQNSTYQHPPTQPPVDGTTKRHFSDVESNSSANTTVPKEPEKTSPKASSKDKDSKLNFTSEKPFKVKQSRSHKSREKPPRFVVGQKKKGIGTCTKKFRSAKSTPTGVEFTSQWKSASPVTSKKEEPSPSDEDEVPGEYIHNTPPTKPQPVEQSREQYATDLDDPETTYVPTNSEMIDYLERLSVCSSLNLPLSIANSVFQGKTVKPTAAEVNAIPEGSCDERLKSFYFSCFGPDKTCAEKSSFNSPAAPLDNNVSKKIEIPSLEYQTRDLNMAEMVKMYEEGKLLLPDPEPEVTSPVLDNLICTCNYQHSPCYYDYMRIQAMALAQNSRSMEEDVSERTDSYQTCSSSNFEDSQFDASGHQYTSTPVTGSARDDSQNGRHELLYRGTGSRGRLVARKRSSSYPCRRSGRLSSGREKSTRSFLDELIPTKDANNGPYHQLKAPAIQCEEDFPTLTAASSLEKNRWSSSDKGDLKNEESVSESDSNKSSLSSDDSMIAELGKDEISPSLSKLSELQRRINYLNFVKHGSPSGCLPNSKAQFWSDGPNGHGHNCGNGDAPNGFCQECSNNSYWKWKKENENGKKLNQDQGQCVSEDVNHMQSDRCGRHTSMKPCRCGCIHPNPPKPPPGFEHLMRPSFPIEQYDPSLLGSLMASQLKHEVMSLSDGIQCEELKAALLAASCCKHHAVNFKRFCPLHNIDPGELDLSDGWDTIERDINFSLDSWNEELGINDKLEFVVGGLSAEGMLKLSGANKPKQNGRNRNCNLAPWQRQTQKSRDFFKPTDENAWKQK